MGSLGKKKSTKLGHTVSTYLPPANEVCEGYVFILVYQSFCSRGVSASVHAGIHPREQTPPRGIKHPQCMLGDMGNKRAVRILLERILVYHRIGLSTRQCCGNSASTSFSLLYFKALWTKVCILFFLPRHTN